MGEYEALPGFVKTQLEFDAANGVLAALRECIQTSELKPSDVQLTATQLQYVGVGMWSTVTN